MRPTSSAARTSMSGISECKVPPPEICERNLPFSESQEGTKTGFHVFVLMSRKNGYQKMKSEEMSVHTLTARSTRTCGGAFHRLPQAIRNISTTICFIKFFYFQQDFDHLHGLFPSAPVSPRSKNRRGFRMSADGERGGLPELPL